MQQHLVPRHQAGNHLGEPPVRTPGLKGCQTRRAIPIDKSFPRVALAEKRAGRDNQHVIGVPNGYADLHPEWSPSDLAASGGSNKSHNTITRCSSTPSAGILVNAAGSTRLTRALSDGPRPIVLSPRISRMDGHRVTGKDLRLNLNVGGIPDL